MVLSQDKSRTQETALKNIINTKGNTNRITVKGAAEMYS